jgi:hypothetical protein
MLNKVATYVNKNTEQPITEQEIQSAIQKTKDKKAPGLDNLNPEIIKWLWKSNNEIIITILNNCFENEIFP